MKGDSRDRNAAPASRSPPTGRALIRAARSQVRPKVVVVVQRELHLDRRRGGRRVGTEAQVRAEDVSVGGARLEDAGQVAGDPDEAVPQAPRAGVLHGIGVVEHHQVDVGGVVELAGAVLAHGQREVPPAPAASGRLLLGQLHLAAPHPVQQQVGDGQADGVVGHVREERAALHDVGDAEAVPRRRDHGHPAPLEAQELHELVPAHRRIGLRQLVPNPADHGVRRILHQALGELQVPEEQSSQVGAVAQQKREEDPALGGPQGLPESRPSRSLGRVAQPGQPCRRGFLPVSPKASEPGNACRNGKHAVGRHAVLGRGSRCSLRFASSPAVTARSTCRTRPGGAPARTAPPRPS